jgi:hypothetical protein
MATGAPAAEQVASQHFKWFTEALCAAVLFCAVLCCAVYICLCEECCVLDAATFQSLACT